MCFAALHPDLKMDWIFDTAPAASVVLPPVTEPRQKIVIKRINAELSEVESPTEFVKRGAWTISRNFGNPTLPEHAKFCLFGG